MMDTWFSIPPLMADIFILSLILLNRFDVEEIMVIGK